MLCNFVMAFKTSQTAGKITCSISYPDKLHSSVWNWSGVNGSTGVFLVNMFALMHEPLPTCPFCGFWLQGATEIWSVLNNMVDVTQDRKDGGSEDPVFVI